MSYLDEVEARLRSDHLEQSHVLGCSDSADSWQEWQDHVVRFVRDAVLASYRNGKDAAAKPRPKSAAPTALAAGKLKPVRQAQ
ncbi:MAG: hypothetical protein Q8R28_05875 [Dehalococcoidia bacterium]|nr:hypothetical protein [Dehalococcoidia bacterium]